MQNNIIIIDYGMGNLYSIYKSLKRFGVNSLISCNLNEISHANKIILPGVGHFSNGMNQLKKRGLIDVLNRKVINEKVPILGICLGMQLFGNLSEEGNTEGLKWIDADIIRFNISDKYKYKIPHMGWNTLKIYNKSLLLNDLSKEDEFYFVHSYHMKCNNDKVILATTEYEYEFVSSIQHDNIMGTQFHPEKSHESGIKILENFALRI